VKHREEAILPLRELRPDVPDRLEAAVMHALARNPDYRPESAAALAEELAVASPDPPTRPLPSTTDTQATEVLSATELTQFRGLPRRRNGGRRMPGGRRLWLALAGIAAAVALVIGLVLGTNGDGGSKPPAQDTPSLQPVRPASDPAGTARNLADWLRQNSR
jgi:hypothetical protein